MYCVAGCAYFIGLYTCLFAILISCHNNNIEQIKIPDLGKVCSISSRNVNTLHRGRFVYKIMWAAGVWYFICIHFLGITSMPPQYCELYPVCRFNLREVHNLQLNFVFIRIQKIFLNVSLFSFIFWDILIFRIFLLSPI